MSQVLSKNCKCRESNFELLRILAMFMVLILHANFKTFGFPNREDILLTPTISSIRVFIEMASVIAVNVFILISGWFGIRASINGFAKFVFQCLFFSIGIYVVCVLFGLTEFSLTGVVECFAIKADDYWFIPSYICLYLFAPVLNAFLEASDRHTIAWVLVTFYIFQFFYSFVGNGANFLMKGYSTLSFMGLYILAYYLRHYIVDRYSKRFCVSLYFCTTVILSIMYLALSYCGYSMIARRLIVYSNPLIVLSSAAFLLFFSKIKLRNKLINYIAISCFSVYLFHSNPNLIDIYIQSIKSVGVNYNCVDILKIIGVIVLWFIIPILLDKVRLLVMKYLFDFNLKKESI